MFLSGLGLDIDPISGVGAYNGSPEPLVDSPAGAI